jgi:hypothetical protein
MTKNELKREVFSRSWAGRLAIILEWTMLSGIMSILAILILTDLLIIEEKNDLFKMILVSMMAASVIMGICVGSQIPISVVFWRILPLNKKAAQKYLHQQKEKLNKHIGDRASIIEAIEKKYQNQIIIADEEIEKSRTALADLIELEKTI